MFQAIVHNYTDAKACASGSRSLIFEYNSSYNKSHVLTIPSSGDIEISFLLLGI
jgi:hypothetical protein